MSWIAPSNFFKRQLKNDRWGNSSKECRPSGAYLLFSLPRPPGLGYLMSRLAALEQRKTRVLATIKQSWSHATRSSAQIRGKESASLIEMAFNLFQRSPALDSERDG